MRNNKILSLNFAKKIGLFLSFAIVGCINPVSKTALADLAQSSQLTESAKQEAASANKGNIVAAKEGAAIKVQHKLDNIATKEAISSENALKSQASKKSADINKDIKKDTNKNQNLLLNDEKSVGSALNALQAAETKHNGSRDYSSQIASDSALIKPVKHWRLDFGVKVYKPIGEKDQQFNIFKSRPFHEHGGPIRALEYRGNKINFLPSIDTVFAVRLEYYRESIYENDEKLKLVNNRMKWNSRLDTVIAVVGASNYLTIHPNVQPYTKFSLGFKSEKVNMNMKPYDDEDILSNNILDPYVSAALGVQFNSSRTVKPYIELFIFNSEPFNITVDVKRGTQTLSPQNYKFVNRSWNHGILLGIAIDF